MHVLLTRPQLNIDRDAATGTTHAPNMPTSHHTLETLPLEIKNEIFSYFLLGVNVKEPVPGFNPSFKYCFQTAILCTSRGLGQEAKAFLYMRNKFAIVSLVQHVVSILKDHAVPVVSRHGLKNFQYHVVRAHFKYDNKLGAKLASCPITTQPLQWLLMLHEDLAHLCWSFQLYNHTHPTDQIFVLSKPKTRPVKWCVAELASKNANRLMLDLPYTPYLPKNLSYEEEWLRQAKLLFPFSFMASCFHRVCFKGIHPGIAAALSETTTCRLVSLDVVLWNLWSTMLHHEEYLQELMAEQIWDRRWFAERYQSLGDTGMKTNTLMSTVKGGTNLIFSGVSKEPEPGLEAGAPVVLEKSLCLYLKAAAIYAEGHLSEKFRACTQDVMRLVNAHPTLKMCIPIPILLSTLHCTMVADCMSHRNRAHYLDVLNHLQLLCEHYHVSGRSFIQRDRDTLEAHLESNVSDNSAMKRKANQIIVHVTTIGPPNKCVCLVYLRPRERLPRADTMAAQSSSQRRDLSRMGRP